MDPITDNMAVTPRKIPPLTDAERADIRAALARLSRGRGVIVRGADLLANGIGSLTGLGLRGLHVPRGLDNRMRGLALALLTRAYDVAILGLNRPFTAAEQRRMSAAVLASGAVGGAAGLAGFIPDASLTTLLIMRAIASEALSQGENPGSESTRRACIEVFLLHQSPATDSTNQLIGFFSSSDEAESALSYPAARLFLRGQPLALLLREAAARYGIVLSQKLATQSVPIIGAAAGAILNAAFLTYYRDLAHAHFTCRRVMRAHGQTDILDASL